MIRPPVGASGRSSSTASASRSGTSWTAGRSTRPRHWRRSTSVSTRPSIGSRSLTWPRAPSSATSATALICGSMTTRAGRWPSVLSVGPDVLSNPGSINYRLSRSELASAPDQSRRGWHSRCHTGSQHPRDLTLTATPDGRHRLGHQVSRDTGPARSGRTNVVRERRAGGHIGRREIAGGWSWSAIARGRPGPRPPT